MKAKERLNICERIFIALLPLTAAAFYIFRGALKGLAEKFPPCVFRSRTGWLCPACGNTRSVLSLLRFDIWSAVKYNITPVVICAVLLCLYIETGAKLFGKKVTLIPKTGWTLAVILPLMFAYYILRNFIPALSAAWR